jgi:hypothetical protein
MNAHSIISLIYQIWQLQGLMTYQSQSLCKKNFTNKTGRGAKPDRPVSIPPRMHSLPKNIHRLERKNNGKTIRAIHFKNISYTKT